MGVPYAIVIVFDIIIFRRYGNDFVFSFHLENFLQYKNDDLMSILYSLLGL